MKKHLLKILAIILAVCCVVSATGVLPTVAANNKDIPQTGDLYAVGENLQIKKAEEGVRIVHTRATEGWERVHTEELYRTTGGGIQLEIVDIASADPDYSLVVMIGEQKGKWYDGPGYMFIYGKSGYFSIIKTDGEIISPNKSEVLVSETREELEESLSINIKLNGSKYVVTVNKRTYTISADGLSDKNDVYLSFGVMGDGNIKGLNFNKSFASSAISYTLAKMSNKMVGADYEPIGNIVSPSAVGMAVTDHLELRESEKGIQVAFPTNAEGWERARFTSAFPVNESGLHIALESFYSEEPDYSIAVMLGGEGNQYYDGAGYIIIYGKSGHFSIIGTDGVTINPNESEVIVSEKREELGEKLTLDIVLKGDTYEATVNGRVYTIPTRNLYTPDQVNLTFGVMGDGNIKTLNYNKSFKKAAVSFVISKETYALNVPSARTLKPFAKYTAFMTGYKDGTFKPEQDLTRGEAIVAIAKLLINKSDIQEVYTSDFTDIKSSDTNYDYYAYMERSGFLPDFGEELKPKQSITRGEFVQLLLCDETAEISNPDETITRGEAAKAICEYIGKTTPIDNAETTFSDLEKTTEYADYILLAANKIKIPTKKYQAASTEDIQGYINQAMDISKTQDVKVTIELTKEMYQLTKPITIDGSSSGEYGLQIIIKNGENVSPVISGNINLDTSRFQKVEGQDYYSCQFLEDEKIDGAWPKFRDLYLGGERLQLARSEEFEFIKDIKLETTADGAITDYCNWFYVDSSVFKDISSETVNPMEICQKVEWNNKRFRIATLYGNEEETGLMQLSVKDEEWYAYSEYEGNKRDFTGWSYWFENHLSLLDEPGEFFYDDANGVIYCYPYTDTDMSNATISYPMVEKLFDMQNVSGISFEGLTFTGTTSNFTTEHGFNCGLGSTHSWNDRTEQVSEDKFFKADQENSLEGWNSEHVRAAAIYGEYSKHITIKNCTFDQLGTNGVYLNGGTNGILVKGNSFTNLAMSAAIFGKQRQLWSEEDGQSNIIIDNNYIYNIGTDYLGSPGIEVARVKNIAVTHNTFLHTPYSGLMMGWINFPSASFTIYNAEVSYNHCEDNLYALNDAAGLYFCGANGVTSESGIYNYIHDNYIKSTGYAGTYNGIYLDMNASNHSVYNNVIEGFDTAHGPIFNQDHATDQYTYNNILSGNYSTIRLITTTAEPERNIQLIDNKQFVSADELPEEAREIVAAAGQKEQYTSSIPKMDTVIEMDVAEPHISVARLGKSGKDNLVFTITNNGKEKATYSIKQTSENDESIQAVASTEFLELKAGETGKIEVAFQTGDVSKRGELFDFAVVKDNGWKREYHRVIEVDILNSYATDDTNTTELLVPIIVGGVVILLLTGVGITVVIKKKKTRKDEV